MLQFFHNSLVCGCFCDVVSTLTDSSVKGTRQPKGMPSARQPTVKPDAMTQKNVEDAHTRLNP